MPAMSSGSPGARRSAKAATNAAPTRMARPRSASGSRASERSAVAPGRRRAPRGSATTTESLAMTFGPMDSARLDAGVEPELQQVHQHVDHHHQEGGQQQDAEQQVEVAGHHRVEGQATEARPAEQGLRDGGSAEERGE